VLFVGHATTLLTLGGVRVLTDPFLRARLGPLERHGARPDPATLRADIVVISHGHRDHFDRRSLESLPGRPILVVPKGLGSAARQVSGPVRVIELEAGDTVETAGVRVGAVPARHWISPGAPRAKPIGYVIEVPAGASSGGPRARRAARIYFAGDTGRFPSMAVDAADVDLALLPVWTWGPHLGPGHLGPRTAASVTAEIRPRAVVPIHWGTLYPRHLHRVWRRPLVEPGDRFAALLRSAAPDVRVHVLRPGEHALIG
jgi:L-ascorbate metabolism protein UlaG (beta-lactamase superfamily)